MSTQALKLQNISRARYTDEAFYQAELKYVFKTQWLMVAHESELPEIGSYLVLDIPFAPVVLVRGEDGKIRAFLNSCRHRGATVVKEKRGRAKRFSCQFHSWTYDLGGALIGVPEIETFNHLDMKDYSLDSLRCEKWGGLIFVNFDVAAEPLMSWLGEAGTRYLDIFSAPLRLVTRKSWEVNCNWKLIYEAFRESYHVSTVHKQTLAPLVDSMASAFHFFKNGHNTSYARYHKSIEEQMSSTEWSRRVHESSLKLLPRSQESEFRMNFMATGIFPNLNIPYQPMALPVQVMWPLAKDRCRMDVLWIGMDWGNSPVSEEWTTLMTAFDVAFEEDLGNLCSIQRSIEANPMQSVPLSTHEILIHQLHAELDRNIPADVINPELRVSPVAYPDYFNCRESA